MQSLDNYTQAFLALVRAGLWEKEVCLSQYEIVDFAIIYNLAEEQSVIGLVTAGLERVIDCDIPKETLLTFIGSTLQIEQRNKEMNDFVVKLFKRLRSAGITAFVVKGQGIAPCYEKPLWRTAGDVDLLLDIDDYEKAKTELYPKAYDVQKEDKKNKHQAMTIMGIDVELHGRMPFSISRKGMLVNDEVVADSLHNDRASLLNINDTEILIPNPDNHTYLVFTHYLLHFFIEGVGLRQICDWCRLLWTFRDKIDVTMLEKRLKRARLMTEWKGFASLAVDYLGMPAEAMPFYKKNEYKNKATWIFSRIIKSGNFGQNNDLSYRTKYRGFVYKTVALWRRILDFTKLVPIFPLDAPSFFLYYVGRKMKTE